MKKTYLLLLLIFIVGLVVFSTWHMFQGNLEAAFSMFPFMVIVYFFVKKKQG